MIEVVGEAGLGGAGVQEEMGGGTIDGELHYGVRASYALFYYSSGKRSGAAWGQSWRMDRG